MNQSGLCTPTDHHTICPKHNNTPHTLNTPFTFRFLVFVETCSKQAPCKSVWHCHRQYHHPSGQHHMHCGVRQTAAPRPQRGPVRSAAACLCGKAVAGEQGSLTLLEGVDPLCFISAGEMSLRMQSEAGTVVADEAKEPTHQLSVSGVRKNAQRLLQPTHPQAV
jgi:hypothetical protein